MVSFNCFRLSTKRLWNDFDSDTDISMNRTLCINYHNVFCKHLTKMSIFLLLVRLELRSASESIQGV